MRKELPAVELLQAVRHLLPEPHIVIEIVLDKLLNVFVRAAAAIRSNTIKLRLDFRCKVHFHVLRVRKAGRTVKVRSSTAQHDPTRDCAELLVLPPRWSNAFAQL